MSGDSPSINWYARTATPDPDPPCLGEASELRSRPEGQSSHSTKTVRGLALTISESLTLRSATWKQVQDHLAFRKVCELPVDVRAILG